MTAAPPYALRLLIRKIGESYVVADINGVALAYVYFEDEPTHRAGAKRLRREDAEAVAQTIARALTAEAEGRALCADQPSGIPSPAGARRRA